MSLAPKWSRARFVPLINFDSGEAHHDERSNCGLNETSAANAREDEARSGRANALELTGQAAGGMVKVTISGKYEMKRVQIDPAAMDDREMLEDLVVTAYTDAFKQAEAASQALMSGATAGMPMPPGFKLPF